MHTCKAVKLVYKAKTCTSLILWFTVDFMFSIIIIWFSRTCIRSHFFCGVEFPVAFLSRDLRYAWHECADFWLVFFMSLSAVMWLKKTVFTLLSVEYENCMLLLTFDTFFFFLVYNFAFASLSFPHFTHAQQNIDILCTYSSYCDIHYISLYGCLWHCVCIFLFF